MSATTHDPSLIDGADPELDRLIEELTRRVQAGEEVDLEAFAREHPGYTEPLRRLLPALEMLAGLSQSVLAEGLRGGAAGPHPAAGLGALGDFRLVREIGRGGMGVVYEAEQISLRRRVALKVLPFAAALDARQIQRFQVEAQAAACLHHEHIVPVHGVGCERGVHYYAMQLIDGQSLAAMIAELRRLDGLDPAVAPVPALAAVSTTELAARLLTGGVPNRRAGSGSDAPTIALSSDASPPEAPAPRASRTAPGRPALSGPSTQTRDYVRAAARLATQAAEALDHAHTRGILHRDIKPANLLLDADGRLWVTDFGLAQVRGEDRLTCTGDVLGTLRYMSPEQALGRRVVIDGRTDVYSLGVTLYELLTLRPAVDGRDPAEVLRRIAEQDPTPLRALNPAVPRDLETIINKAMEKDPAARYATARDLVGDLRSYLEDRPIRARRPNAAERAWRWGRRHRALAGSAATAALVAALILAGGIGYLARDRAARVAQTGQRVAESLAGARTAIEAGDLTLAGQRVAEAQGRLGADGALLRDLAAEISGIRREIDARQADAARFSLFLKGASDAQGKVANTVRIRVRAAEENLGLYGVLTEKEWLSRLESTYLTADQKQQVRERAYVTLVSLADYCVRYRFTMPEAVERSLGLLQRAQAFHQPTRAFYFVRAQCRRAQGDTAAADEDEKQFKATPARTTWDYNLPGHAAERDGDLNEAIRCYQAALRLQPNHYNSFHCLACCFNTDKINRRPEAIAYFTACVALRPDDPVAYSHRGECYITLGQWDDAITDFLQFLRLSPDDSHDGSIAHSVLGYALWGKGRLDEAIAELREAVRLRPDIAANQHNLAAFLADCRDPKLRDPARAVEHARRAVELAPKRTEPWYTLGLAYYRAGDWKAAIAALESAVELEKDAEAWQGVGKAHYRNGEGKAAIAALGSMGLGNAADGYDWFHLAMAHWKLGHNDEARAWYDKAVAWKARNLSPFPVENLRRHRAEAEALMGLADLPADVFARP
jgi:tetratricopeptide (TPR) repeat protein